MKKKILLQKICCLFPTSIFFQSSELRLGFKKLKKNISFIFTAKKYDHPIQRSFQKKGNLLVMANQKMENKNTQDFRPHYHDAAQFYLGWRKSWLEKKSIFHGKTGFIEIPKLYSQDIDTFDDWRIALALWKLKKTK